MASRNKTLTSNYPTDIDDTRVSSIDDIRVSSIDAIDDIITFICQLIGTVLFAEILASDSRGLTDYEIAEAKKIFGKAFDLDKVKVLKHSWILSTLNAFRSGVGKNKTSALVILNTIHVDDYKNFGGSNGIPLLIHELMHVYQSVQSIVVYIPYAWFDQAVDGYDITPDIVKGNSDIRHFGVEQQSEIIETYWVIMDAICRYRQEKKEDVVRDNVVRYDIDDDGSVSAVEHNEKSHDIIDKDGSIIGTTKNNEINCYLSTNRVKCIAADPTALKRLAYLGSQVYDKNLGPIKDISSFREDQLSYMYKYIFSKF